jgi:hypothetical protein
MIDYKCHKILFFFDIECSSSPNKTLYINVFLKTEESNLSHVVRSTQVAINSTTKLIE